jgi:hypothetical protein
LVPAPSWRNRNSPFVREIAERMIEEMRENVGKHDEATREPHLADADPAQPPRNARRSVRRADIDDCGCQYSHVEFVLPDG